MQCEQCAYGRYPKIPRSVPHPAQLAIVGEAPGNSELARKQPFVGLSGKLLRRTLDSVGISDTRNVFITNAMLCRPPVGKPIQRDPVNKCRGRLIEELKIAQPKVILALGNTALHSLTGSFNYKITNEQGRVLESPLLPGTLIVPCFHPAKILRTPGDFKSFKAAFEYAAHLLHGGTIRHPGFTKFIVADPKLMRDYIDFLSKYEVLGSDIETGGTRLLESKVLDLGIAYEKNKVIIFPEPLIPRLKPLFELKKPLWVWHNGQFDTGYLRRYGLPARIDHDTILQHYCLNENEGGHDLETLSAQFLGAEDYKGDIHKIAGGKKTMELEGYSKVPKEILYPYLAKDCDYTLQLHNLFLPKVEEDPDLKKLYYELLLPATRFLRRVQRTGIYPNKEYLFELEEKLHAKAKSINKEILEHVKDLWDPIQYMEATKAKKLPKKFNPASSKQLSWLVYDVMRFKPMRGKGRSTDKEVIAHYKDEHPMMPLIAELRSTRKMMSTYVKGVLKNITIDDRVHSSYLLFSTVTGRLSSRGPNLQNIPNDPDIRAIFQAPPGRRLMEADYKAAELRVLAHISGDPYLKQVYEEGRDLHSEVAEMFFGPNFTKMQRVQAKTFNFGIAYGRTEYSIAEAFGISVEEARMLIAQWFARAPKAAEYLLSCDAAAERGEVLVTPFGRKRRFGLVTPEIVDDLKNEARNFRIQSIASDLTLTSAMALETPIKMFDAKIVNLVHDSILIEMPDRDDLVQPLAKLVTSTMSHIPKIKLGATIPFEADVHVGYKWGYLNEIQIT